MSWPVTCAECVQIAGRYRAAGQWTDAGVEYLKAAARAPDREAETELLEQAFVMLTVQIDADGHLGARGGE